MSNGPIRPSTLEGVKRYAKSLKTSQGLTHAEALDAAAASGGFQNFRHARRRLVAPTVPGGHVAHISVVWRIREPRASGQEILAVQLGTPLLDLVKPHHLTAARHFAAFRFAAPDHLRNDLVASSQSEARRWACVAARTLTFMEATGLRPSAGRSRAYPRGDFRNAMPGHDHASEWFDPQTKAYVFVDEPYERGVEAISPQRLAWAEKHGWQVTKPTWKGMYNPDGGCELFLAADKAKGFRLDTALAALNALPAPIAESDWGGRSEPISPSFVSPAARSLVATRTQQRPRLKRGPNATVGYRTLFSRSERRRPAKRMPVEAHAEVGRLLKSVIYDMRGRRNVYKPLDGVRCDLDDWVQCEYDRTELPNEIFYDLYYHKRDPSPELPSEPTSIERHVDSLSQAKTILVKHYPDCSPLRSLLKAIDKSIAILQVLAPESRAPARGIVVDR